MVPGSEEHGTGAALMVDSYTLERAENGPSARMPLWLNPFEGRMVCPKMFHLNHADGLFVIVQFFFRNKRTVQILIRAGLDKKRLL